MPLGSLSANRSFSKSLSVDFKRKEASKIVIENSSLVSRIISKTAFLPISKINRDNLEHEQYLQMIRKMDATSNKMKVKGLEKLSIEKLRQLPHIQEIERGSPLPLKSSKDFRSKSFDVKKNSYEKLKRISKENQGNLKENKKNLKENSKENIRVNSKENIRVNSKEKSKENLKGNVKGNVKENVNKEREMKGNVTKEENIEEIRVFSNEFL